MRVINRITTILLIMACTCILIFCAGCFSHIPDENGSEDYSLCIITEEEILDTSNSFFRQNAINGSENNGNRFSKAEWFSGVYSLQKFTISDEECYQIHYSCVRNSGNLRIVLIKDGQIIQDFNQDENSPIAIEQAGDYEIKIAGESAQYVFNWRFV